MPEAGLFSLTKILAGALSAVATGPFGGIDLPDGSLDAAVTQNVTGYIIEAELESGDPIGFIASSDYKSPPVQDLPNSFLQALIAIEDARFGVHPGVDPLATFSAAIDTFQGNQRGGSTLTQQMIKNTVTSRDVTIARKIEEAILSVRAQAAFTPDDILQSYLAHAWFGRGQSGAAGASLAWFGKPWKDIEVHEAAFLAGILKGPAYYDPVKFPERALERRNLVLKRMRDQEMIDDIVLQIALSEPLEVISNTESEKVFSKLPKWIEASALRFIEEQGLEAVASGRGGTVSVTLSHNLQWQEVTEDALRKGIESVGGLGPAGRVDLGNISKTTDLEALQNVRQKAATFLTTSRTMGRAIVIKEGRETSGVFIDRGYGNLEYENVRFEPGYTPKRGDVLPYTRKDTEIYLQPVPQVQGAAIVMDPLSGKILASVGGYDSDTSLFDRTVALRQPGSSIKPFMWLAALEGGMGPSDPVMDREVSYFLPSGQIWTPRNYNGAQAGTIPLHRALEQSSNLVAASLVDLFGVESLAQITESAGLYAPGGMARNPSSVLGVSETSLERMAAGYSAIANGGRIVSPVAITDMKVEGASVWKNINNPSDWAIATTSSVLNVQSMLYGVTQRGTAARAFRDVSIPVAGKTGTTQNYKDAWFISMTPSVVVAVWVGRDDSNPIPGERSGSTAAAPIVANIYNSAVQKGLLDEQGVSEGPITVPWPPTLLESPSYTPRAGNQGSRSGRSSGYLTQNRPQRKSQQPVRNAPYSGQRNAEVMYINPSNGRTETWYDERPKSNPDEMLSPW